MTPLELLQQLNDLDEHPAIEAKTGSEMGRSMLETICAFANEPGLGGGWLLLGVRRDDQAFWKQYEVVGVPDPDKLQNDLVSQCTTSFNIPIRPQIEVTEVRGKRLVSVFVSEVPASAKPVFFTATGLPKGAYRRIGSADVRCTEEDLAVFYGDRPSQTFDLALLPDAEMEEIDPAAVAEYRRLRSETSPGAEELLWGDDDLLRSLRCADKDASGLLRPTVAGILLFGKSTALRRHFPMMRVDYIRVPGRQWVEDPDRRFDTLELRVPLIRLVGRALQAILDDLPKAFSLPADAIHRKDVPLIPTRVLREAIVNAIMHRSYRVHSPVQIIRYANRLEIRNPGYSLVAEERWGEPGSITRNPNIAAVLHEVNLAETKGSGIRVMRQIMRDSDLTPPTFDSDRQNDRFVATFLFHHFLGADDWQWLRSLQVTALSDEEARALVFVRETFSIDNAAYRDLNLVDTLNASQHLRRLRDQGMLQQRGKGSATYYVPTDQFLATLDRDSPAASTPEAQGDNLAGKGGKLTREGGKLATKGGKLRSEGGKLPRTEESLASSFPSLPLDLVRMLAGQKQRITQPELWKTVENLCAWIPLSVDDLAILLDKSPKYLRNRLLTPMLKAGRLEMLYPGQPNHPQQAYRTPRLPTDSSSST